jgi:hypothetical protein
MAARLPAGEPASKDLATRVSNQSEKQWYELFLFSSYHKTQKKREAPAGSAPFIG